MAGNEESADVTGHRHGSRARSLTGTFGAIEIAVPRARLNTTDGKTTEWKSKALRAYQRRTLAADALIAGAYLAGTNTRRVRRSLAVQYWRRGGRSYGEPGVAQGADRLGRLECPLRSAEEPISTADSRRHGGACAARPQGDPISLFVVLGVRADGQKVLLAIKSMGGESAEGSRTVLDDLIKRGLRRPAFLIVDDGAPGTGESDCRRLEWRTSAAMHGSQASQFAGACAERLHRGNRRRLYRHDLCSHAGRHRRYVRKAFIRKWRVSDTVPSPTAWRKPAHQLFAFTQSAAEPMAQRADHECDRTTARGVQASDQNADRPAIGRDCHHVVLGAACFRPNQHAQSRRLADAR